MCASGRFHGSPSRRESGTELIVDMPDEPVMADVDPRRVERILRNLLANAIDHGEGKPILLRLRADDNALAFIVRDSGVGLRPGEEKLVFNRFWRSDPSRVRRSGGTGLGLAISVEDANLQRRQARGLGRTGSRSLLPADALAHPWQESRVEPTASQADDHKVRPHAERSRHRRRYRRRGHVVPADSARIGLAERVQRWGSIMIGTRRRLALLATTLSVLLLTGACASLPESSSPQAIGTLATAVPGTSVESPASGREPDLLVRDFVKASTDPSNRHAAARQYLTKDASARWDDAASAVIVDKVDVLSVSRTSTEAVYTIRVNKVGRLDPGGLYVPEEGSFEARMTLALTDGEWRISDLPPGVIMERPQFLGAYQRKSLFFLDPTSQTVVPDLRWISGGQDQVAAQLIGLMIDGPKAALAPAVRNELGNGVSVIGPITKADGKPGQVGVGLGGVRINFRLDNPMDAATRGLFAAQVIWTLANADVAGPYVLEIDRRTAGTRLMPTAGPPPTSHPPTHWPPRVQPSDCMHCATVHW